jgi:hypothetical protein
VSALLTPEAVMAIERRFPGAVDDGRKSSAVLLEHGLSMTRYTQRLNTLLDDPAFVVLDPVLVRILRQRRAYRLKSRRAA